jgi:hypothetical protein
MSRRRSSKRIRWRSMSGRSKRSKRSRRSRRSRRRRGGDHLQKKIRNEFK